MLPQHPPVTEKLLLRRKEREREGGRKGGREGEREEDRIRKGGRKERKGRTERGKEEGG